MLTMKDTRSWEQIQAAGEGVPAVPGSAERPARGPSAVRDQPADPREGQRP